jgi:hypothetical protein
MERNFEMNTPTEIVRSFYAALATGDAPRALGLMADDIEWKTMWHYKVDGVGPQKVAEGLLKPLMGEWASFKLESMEFLADGETVVSLGRLMSRPPQPPFIDATAAEKARLAEDAWNSRNPERVALAYTPDSQWRNRVEFIVGRDQIEAFLAPANGGLSTTTD